MFKINLSSFLERTELKFDLKKDEINFGDDLPVIDSLRVNLILTKQENDVILVQGELKCEVIMKCSRCLDRFNYSIGTDFTVLFKKKEIYNNEDAESGILLYDKNEIELFDYIRETLLLEIPVKPLCSENCKGLCPVCGANLNKQQCNCKNDIGNNPFKFLEIK